MEGAVWRVRLQEMRDRASRLPHTVVVSDGEDERAQEAVCRLLEESGGQANLRFILVGDVQSVRRSLARGARSLLRRPSAVEVVSPTSDPRLPKFAELYLERMVSRGKGGGITVDAARERVARPERFAAMLVAAGAADGMLGGAASPTADVIRAGLEIVGLRAGSPVVSG
ncbi:MAG: phosphate acetyltransferase, partial [Alicyclobacillus sp.]|nr:phosphate acetyltransferase [Alicyclobacillus sp.]